VQNKYPPHIGMDIEVGCPWKLVGLTIEIRFDSYFSYNLKPKKKNYKVLEMDVIIDGHFNLCNKYWYIFLEKEGIVIVWSMLQYIP